MSNQARMQITTNRFKIVGYDKESIYENLKLFVKYHLVTNGVKVKTNPKMRAPAKALVDWFHCSDQSGARWLCLMGGVGTGKSTLLEQMYRYIRGIQLDKNGAEAHHAPFSCYYLRATDLADIIANDRATWNVIKNYQMIFLDDVGTEPKEVLSYGNGARPFEELINNRYNNCLGLVFTTNLSASQIRDRYEGRVADRLKGEWLQVPMVGESMRTPHESVEGCPF